MKGFRPRQAVLAGGTPRPRAAAGFPRGGLSEPLFVSAPGEGRVMSLLPGAGKRAGYSHLPRALPPPRISAARRPPPRPELQGWGAPDRPRAPAPRPGKAPRARAGLRGRLQRRLRPRKLQSEPGSRSPATRAPPPPPPPRPLPRAGERGAPRTHLGRAERKRPATPWGWAPTPGSRSGVRGGRPSSQRCVLAQFVKTLSLRYTVTYQVLPVCSWEDVWCDK